MSSQIEQNLERLLRLSNRKNSADTFVSVGIARNINKEKRTCDIELSKELILYDCRLNAVIDKYNNHVLILPKEGSQVVFQAMDGRLAKVLVIAYSEIDAVNIRIGDTNLKMDAAGVVFNEGTDGAVNLKELKDNLDNLKSYCEALKTAIDIGLTEVKAGNAADGPGGASAFNSSMSGKSITLKDMEDKKLKH